MVKYFFIVYGLIMHALYEYCQTCNPDTISDDITIMYLSEAPCYKGGIDSLKSFIARNLKYPPAALEDKIEGTVIVRFVIDTTGFTIDHTVVRSIRKDLDEEAVRISKLIVFSPAKQGDNPVQVPFTVPFEFKTPRKW